MCWYCGEPVTESEPIGRSLKCAKCGKDLRSCANCRFFKPLKPGSLQGDCAESQGENPAEKDRATFCDWFSLNPRFRRASEGSKPPENEARSARTAFDNLFT